MKNARREGLKVLILSTVAALVVLIVLIENFLVYTNVSFQNFAVDDECEILNSTAVHSFKMTFLVNKMKMNV